MITILLDMIKAATKTKVIGVEISQGRTTYAIVDIRGNILAYDTFNTHDYENVNEYASVLCEKMVDLMLKHNCFEEVRSVGISAPSGNFMTGCIENSPNLPWKGVIPLAAMVRDRLGMAVALGNDAHAMALGEHTFGFAHGMKDFILVTLGNGMGSSIFSNGQFYLGNDGFSGEIGHSCIEPGGRQCGCGKKGCLECYTSGKGIVMTAQELMAATDEPSLMRSTEPLTSKAIAMLCDQGDQLAIKTMRITGNYLGRGLANYASLLNPEGIIFMGGVTKAGKWLFDPANEEFEKYVYHNMRGKVKFLLSTLETHEREVLGASVLAWEVKEYSLFK